MNIIIVGGGFVGEALAQQLEHEKIHNITVVESNPDKSNALAGKLDVLLVNGSGTEPAVLIEAGIEKAHMVVAVTPSDESNILISYLASKFDVETRVARIRSRHYSNSHYDLKALGVTDIINPEDEVADYILEHLYISEAKEFYNFKNRKIRLYHYEVTEDNPLCEKPSRLLPEISGNNRILHLMIIRDNETLIPSGDTVIKTGDEILTLLPDDATEDFRKLFNNGNNLGKTIITGSSSTAELLAKKLENHCSHLILISEDEDFCQKISETLHNVEVLFGDPANEEVLAEAGISNTEFFVPVDDDSEENIITGVLAKADGAQKVVAVTNQTKHVHLFKTLGIDTIVRPSDITTQKLFSEISGFSNNAIIKDTNMDLHIGHFEVSDSSKLAGLSVLELRKNAKCDFIIGGIIHNGEFIVAHGDTQISPEDEIVVFYQSRENKKIRKFFKA